MNWTPPEGCQGLIFDCDGTLVDSMPLHYKAWSAVLQRYNLEFTEARFYQWAGMPVDDIIHRLADEQGQKVDAVAVAEERDDYFHSFPESELQPVPAVLEIAKQFRGKLPMAVATGSTLDSARASLKAIGVVDWFDAIVSSWDTGRPKPAPDVFLRAAKCINITPEACVAFEDGESGMQAARTAGMYVVDIRPWLPR